MNNRVEFKDQEKEPSLGHKLLMVFVCSVLIGLCFITFIEKAIPK